MSDIAILLGLALAFIGSILFLIAAFRTSILWGLGCLLVPFISFFFLIIHWQVAKKPFLMQVIGFSLIVLMAIAEQEGLQIPSTMPAIFTSP